MTLLVGGASADITPSRALPNYNGGMCSPGDGENGLHCHAITLEDGHSTIALIAVDATFVDRALLLRIRDACARRTGICGERVIVAATHTHLAPATCPSFLSGALPDPQYLDSLVERAARSVAAALERAEPALLVAGSAPAAGVEHNRRYIRPDGGISFFRQDGATEPEGPTDDAVGFLGFETADGRPLAIVASYPCHNNAAGSSGGAYDRDFFGRAGAALRERFPTLHAASFLAGACGNVGFRVAPAGKRSEVLSEGSERAADLIAAAYRRVPRVEVDGVSFVSHTIDVPDRPYDESTFCHDGCRGTTHEAHAAARRRYDPEANAVRNRGATSCTVELTALGLRDAALITNPAELFVEFGLEIKQRSPFGTTLVSELTNGYCGYVPTTRAFERGGYETHRTVYTSRLVKDAGARIVEESVSLLEQIHGVRSPVALAANPLRDGTQSHM